MARRPAALLLILGAVLGMVGGIAPWISHPAAGLNVGGFSLFETTKFLPGVQSGEISLFREAFLLPFLSGVLLLALLPALTERPFRPIGWLPAVAAAFLALSALPPYPALLTAHRDPAYRGQLLLVVATLVLAPLAPLARRLPRTARSGLLALLSLGGTIPGLIALVRVRPAFSSLYGAPAGIGWGVGACILSSIAVLAAAYKLRASKP